MEVSSNALSHALKSSTTTMEDAAQARPHPQALAAQELATTAPSSAGTPPPPSPSPWRLLYRIHALPRRKIVSSVFSHLWSSPSASRSRLPLSPPHPPSPPPFHRHPSLPHPSPESFPHRPALPFLSSPRVNTWVPLADGEGERVR
jgi:hypothetical protein